MRWQGQLSNNHLKNIGMDNEIAMIKKQSEFQDAEVFISSFLSIPPPKQDIAVNKMANNSMYLPISFVETKLDELFFGAWETVNFQYQVVANEIIGSIDLKVFHPVFHIWVTRTGCASVMIQMKSERNGGDGDITNVRNKITNTLEKDFPHLKAECIKNAARSLGKAFGRDLNRKEVDFYEALTPKMEFTDFEKRLKEQLGTCCNLNELGLLWESLEGDERTDNITRLFTQRKAQINAGIIK